jgi:hypothetical protein
MPRDTAPTDDTPTATAPRRRGAEATRGRAALLALGAIALLVLGSIAWRQVTLTPGPAQMILVSRGGEVLRVLGPGQSGFLNPWTHTRATVDMALTTTDRSANDLGIAALSAEGHPVTVYGTAFWHEGSEADLRWRFAHIRTGVDPMPPLMASAVQAVLGRRPMEEIIRDTPALQAALTEELRNRARELLRIEVAAFAVTRLDPGESYRAVVAERELGRARAVSIAASPALATENPNAVDVEMIRRWDGRGVIPESLERRDRRQPER